jgi:hypothetical protein
LLPNALVLIPRNTNSIKLMLPTMKIMLLLKLLSLS